jgi:hypothetical protein
MSAAGVVPARFRLLVVVASAAFLVLYSLDRSEDVVPVLEGKFSELRSSAAAVRASKLAALPGEIDIPRIKCADDLANYKNFIFDSGLCQILLLVG